MMRIALACCLLVGCIPPADDLDVDPTPEPDVDPEPDPDPMPDPDPTPAAVASGTYKVRTQIELTVGAVLPEPAYDMVATLHAFSQNPARTLFDVAEDAGVPAVEQIRDALPQVLESKLEGWINDEIAGLELGGVPVTQLAANIAAVAELGLTRFAIESELSIDGATATHTLTTLDLTPAGLDATFALAALPANVISANPTCASGNGTLALGDHGYALAYGAYVWDAIEARVTTELGGTIRATLGAAVNCPAIATAVSNKCVLGVCVGHRAELIEICEAGLDEIVERVRDKFVAQRIDGLRFAAGTATLVDTNQDGPAERLDDGVWTAEINAGQGLRPVPATFAATK